MRKMPPARVYLRREATAHRYLWKTERRRGVSERRRQVDFSHVRPYKSFPRRIDAYSSSVVGNGPGDYFRLDICGRSFTADFLRLL